MNLNLLKGKIAENDYTFTKLAKELNLSQTCITHKMQGKVDFKSSEIRQLKDMFNLTSEEIVEIFL